MRPIEQYEKNVKWLEDHYPDGGRMWPEEASFVDGWEGAHEHMRAAAFGAIRRAVEIARELDDLSENADYPSLSYEYAEYAHNVRRAIRAAIGSDKA